MPEPVEPVAQTPAPREATPAEDPVALAIAALGARVEQVRTTLKWVGGLIVVALFFAVV